MVCGSGDGAAYYQTGLAQHSGHWNEVEPSGPQSDKMPVKTFPWGRLRILSRLRLGSAGTGTGGDWTFEVVLFLSGPDQEIGQDRDKVSRAGGTFQANH